MTTRCHTFVDSPVGLLTLVAQDGKLCGLYMPDQRHRPADEAFGELATAAPFDAVAEQLDEYFHHGRTTFDVPLELAGTPFQRAVWSALREIPYGCTTTYGALAAQLDRPGASRAVGLANGANPVGIIVPCHRVVGASGRLTGYGGGLDRKAQLLELESQHAAPTLLTLPPELSEATSAERGGVSAEIASVRKLGVRPPASAVGEGR